MKSLWNHQEASQFTDDLAQRVYTSRLLGRDSSLVLHGGGNTSVKTRVKNVFGEYEDILYVKGSGWDLETIEAAGFSPCRMPHLLRLAQLPALSDPQMANELRACMTNPNAPAPSVEAILHAILPHKFVDHTHADAFIAITNTPTGDQRVKEIYGDRVVIIPYVMPGFKLAKLCAELFPKLATGKTIGMALLHHGLFSFGATAQESYERMIELVTLAEQVFVGAASPPRPGRIMTAGRGGNAAPTQQETLEIATLRREVSEVAGFPVILTVQGDVGSPNREGPATPDHVLRTKRLPLIGRDVKAYAEAYRQYFREYGNPSLTMLDPAPRVILDDTLGLCTVGRSVKEAGIVADIYRHTIDIIHRAEHWQALPARDIFDVEYWDLEQAKLRKAGPPPVFAGEVALVTGAASGIGNACMESFRKRGAAVVGLDLQPCPDGIVCDLTNEAQIRQALAQAIRQYGGLDMLVLNAGIFPQSSSIAELTMEQWRKVMQVNLDATFALMREAYPFLKLAPNGGRVVVIGSKNVPAPGPGAAAYSASKAAVNQLARVAALEWGKDRIRINTLHPNMVFDTAIWTPAVLESRARHYGLTIEQYKTNNLLHIEITSRDVAELAATMCTSIFAKTTGAQVPVDGGNDRVI
ncbi:MAG: 3-phenylpropionate-dihydrodiol/cinnamic acid-dihydrodiol dehydrogenase [Verrucomicrobiae bacterium]|nr:3-phenylpropionate-dihydrodiol/cinnamic acid-dihydrodiol dehydrogenase [Verrucomicrobiae bacterium]